MGNRGLFGRTLSLVLAVALVVSLAPVTAMAETEDGLEEVVVVELGNPDEAESTPDEAPALEVEPVLEEEPAPDAEPAPDEALVVQSDDEDGLQSMASGKWGTCSWTISDNVLRIGAGKGQAIGTFTEDGNWYITDDPWADYRDSIKQVVFDKGVVFPTISNQLLYALTNVTTIDLRNVDFSNVSNAYGLFSFCGSLASCDLTCLDTSNLSNMGSLFSDCTSLGTVKLAGIDTSNVLNMCSLFSGCSQLKTVTLSNLDTSNVGDMSLMFEGCSSLTSLDLSSFDTRNAYKVHNYDTGEWCDGLSEMFDGCKSLATVKLGSKFSFTGDGSTSCTLPAYSIKGHKDWWSTKAGAWFTAAKIASSRSKVADTYTKVPTTQSISGAKVAAVADKPYTGSQIKPTPAVTLGGKTLKLGTDYTLSYTNNVKVGRATIVVKGKGKYTGTKKASFRIAFKDVPAGHQFYEKVHLAVEAGLIEGYGKGKEGTFGPGDSITRGQIAVILWRMAGKPKAGSSGKNFPDVKTGAFYYEAVRWASSKGVVNGYKTGKFGPNDNITREQLAVMVANYASKMGKVKVSGSAADYKGVADGSSVSTFARSSVGWCYKKSILVLQGSKLNPKAKADRATTAQMAYDLFRLLK